jgi:hypothetical protein
MKRTIVAAQGEAKVFRIDALPDFTRRDPERNAAGQAIISHSESGHHHVIADCDAEVMERTDKVPAGMAILYAIVKNPTALRQDAPHPHGEIPLPPGIYEFRIAREFDPFAEQVRRVKD